MIGQGPQRVIVEVGGQVAASLKGSLRTAQIQVSSFGRNVSRTMNDAALSSRRSIKGIFDNALWQQAAVGATAFAGAIGLSVREAVKFDSAMADIRKAIDFKEGEKGVKQFGRELIKLSTELPYTAEQLTKIAASAGFAGYAQEEIIPFTKSAAAMGVAFQMTAEQAGESMVAIRAAMGLTQPEVVQLGDAINFLSDKFQGTVNAADLVEVTKRIGAIGKAAGLAKEEVAGLGAAFLASGTPAEVAATGLKNFLNALTKGEQATKNQVGALKTIFGKDVSSELAKGMQTNARATIGKVIEGMARLPKEQQVSIAGALFGEESKQAIMPLLTNTKLIGQAFDLIAEKSTFAGSMQKEFQNQMGTSAAQSKIFQNGIQAVGISVGSALLPSLNSILKTVTPILVSFAEWAQKNEGLVTGLVIVGGALAGLVIALPIIGGVIGGITAIGGAIAAATPIIAGIGTVLAIIGGPITITIALVSALAVGAFLIVRNWKSIGPFFSNLWTNIVSSVRKVGPMMLALLMPVPALIMGLFSRANIGRRIITSIIDGLKARASALFSWIGGAISRIGSMVGGGPQPTATATPPISAPATSAIQPIQPPAANNIRPIEIPGRALGGAVRAGMPYLVGERRPELFVPGLDGAVIPRVASPISAAALAALLAAPVPPAVAAQPPAVAPAPRTAPPSITLAPTITINVTGGDGNAAAEIAREVRRQLDDLVAQAESSYRTALHD